MAGRRVPFFLCSVLCGPLTLPTGQGVITHSVQRRKGKPAGHGSYSCYITLPNYEQGKCKCPGAVFTTSAVLSGETPIYRPPLDIGPSSDVAPPPTSTREAWIAFESAQQKMQSTYDTGNPRAYATTSASAGKALQVIEPPASVRVEVGKNGDYVVRFSWRDWSYDLEATTTAGPDCPFQPRIVDQLKALGRAVVAYAGLARAPSMLQSSRDAHSGGCKEDDFETEDETEDSFETEDEEHDGLASLSRRRRRASGTSRSSRRRQVQEPTSRCETIRETTISANRPRARRLPEAMSAAAPRVSPTCRLGLRYSSFSCRRPRPQDGPPGPCAVVRSDAKSRASAGRHAGDAGLRQQAAPLMSRLTGNVGKGEDSRIAAPIYNCCFLSGRCSFLPLSYSASRVRTAVGA